MISRNDIPHLLTLLDDEDPWVRDQAHLALGAFDGDLLVLLRSYSLNSSQWAILEPIIKPFRQKAVTLQWIDWMDGANQLHALEQAQDRLSWAAFGYLNESVPSALNKLAIKFKAGDFDYSIEGMMKFLFESEGFGPPNEDFFHPKHSILSEVLRTGKGLQISLSTIAMLLGQRLGLPVFGFNNPGHFMILTQEHDVVYFRDPFKQGRPVGVSTISALPPGDFSNAFDYYQADTSTIINRVLNNLVKACGKYDLESDVIFYQELINLSRIRKGKG